jgi:hypothetical protein
MEQAFDQMRRDFGSVLTLVLLHSPAPGLDTPIMPGMIHKSFS